jgi:hypothetical protein
VGPLSSGGIADTARVLGACRFVEQRCFEVVGRWAADPAPADVRVLFATLSSHHAWRADLLATRLPVATEIDTATVTAPDPAGAALLSALSELPVDGTARLAVLARVVLPHLAGTYGDTVAASPGPSDAIGRIVRVARDDARHDWHGAAGALRRHLVDGDAVERAGRAVIVVDTAVTTTFRDRLGASKQP